MVDKRVPKYSKIKFEEMILNEINFSLRKDFSDPRLTMISVTHVELTKDYAIAKVFWDTFESKKRGDAKKAIEGITGKMRSILAEKLVLRHVPQITFIYNSQYEDEANITKLLHTNEEQE